MSDHTCPTCGSTVRIVGNTTLRYEPVDTHQATKAELERWKSLAEDAVERLAQYDDDYDLENGMDAGALANQDMIERLDAARAGQEGGKQ